MAGLIVALVVALAWSVVAVRLGPHLGFVDRPDDPALKAHLRPAVPLGGVGVFLGVHTGLAVEGAFDAGLVGATGAALLLGLVDDRVSLPAVPRLVAETGVAVALLGLSDIDPGPAQWVAGLVLVVVAVNAVNLFDGLDGLVALSGIVAAAGIAWLLSGRELDPAPGLTLAGALAGFSVLNWHPARVFLGDNGSYVVGVFLAYGILMGGREAPISGVVVALLLLGVFGLDLVVTILRRRRAGRPLFVGDRSHIYDQLRTRGWSVPRVALGAALAEAGFAAAAVTIDATARGWAAVGLTVVVGTSALAAVALAGFVGPKR